VEVNEIEIERIAKNEIRLVVMYRDLPDVRKARHFRPVKRPGRIKDPKKEGGEKGSREDVSGLS
jgi:hypothetical protein